MKLCAPTQLWKLSTMLLIFVTTLNLIQGSQKSLTTAESPTDSLKVIQDRKNGSFPCRRNQQCCKLGRKAARKSYTCQFEALSKSLEYQTASSDRLNPAAHRMQAALSYHNHAQAFRRRLHRCQDPLNKKCFQYCCKTVSEKLLRRDTLKRVSAGSSNSRNITNSSRPAN